MWNSLFLRHKQGADRRSPRSRYEPLGYDHPLVGQPCAECGRELRAGDRPTLFAVGPQDLESGQLADTGRWYNACALPMHESCAWPERPEENRRGEPID